MTSNRTPQTGFTLPELLVSMTILLLIMLLLTSMLSQVQKTWNFSEGRISQFREARVAFDVISKNLGQASVNTYWDYDYDDATGQPKQYQRQSELHFASFNTPPSALRSTDGTIVGHSFFFQAPLGFSNKFRNLSSLYNGRGYYIMFGGDSSFRPSFFEGQDRFRFRLMEYFPPSEENQVFNDGDEDRLADRDVVYDKWWNYDLEFHSHPLAENIIALIVAPRDALRGDGSNDPNGIASDFEFDSAMAERQYRNQVPPLVSLTMVAIDEESAIQLAAEYGDSLPPLVKSDLFENSLSYETDLESLKKDLIEKRVDFKVFNTIVAIRTSKWSTYNGL